MRAFVKGVNWTVFQQATYVAVNYVSLILLAWYLSPDDFGIVALSTVLVGLFEILNGFGVPQLIIKDQVTDERRLGYYLGVCLILSAGLALACSLGGLLYVQWYRAEIRWDVAWVISVSSLGLLFNSTTAFFNALYQRDLDFKTPALFYTFGLLGGNALAVACAALEGGYWALVLRNLATPALVALGFALFSRYRPALHLRSTLDTNEKRFTLWLSGNQAINYLSRNLDYLIIGRFFEVSIVGQYSIAYRMMLFPMKFLSSRVQSVLYPTLARMQGQPEAMVDFYVKVISFIGFVSFPLMGLAGVSAPLWVPLLFDGERYGSLIPLIQWLTIAGAFQSVTAPIGSLYLTNNLVRMMTLYSAASAAAFAAGYVAGAWSGNIVTFAMIYTLMSVAVNFFAANYVPLRRLGYSYRIFLVKTLPPLFPATMAYLSIRMLMQPWAPNGIAERFSALAGLGAVFAASYVAAYALLHRSDLHRKLSKLKSLYS